MKGFHAICGLPRAGSTLLQNILNQNPAFRASSTSALCGTLDNMSRFWTLSSEIKSDLANDQEGTEQRLQDTLRAVAEAWYPTDHVVFDKARGWITMVDLVANLWPDSKLICCVRDPREVFASVERQDKRFAALNDNPPGDTIVDKAQRIFSPTGLAGGPCKHIENAIRKRSPYVLPVVYEKFVAAPEKELKKLYIELDQPWYDGHDFDNVEATATDLDALYLNNFPHKGSGKVEPRASTWPDVVPGDVANLILKSYPLYSQAFGYA